MTASARSAGRASETSAPAGALLLSLAVGAVTSTQMLVQPFVWRHWPIDEVLYGWLLVLAERLLVSLAIGLALASALLAIRRLASVHRLLRTGLFALMAATGALAGETLLVALGLPGAAHHATDLVLRSLRWSAAALAIAGLVLTWLRAVQVQSSMRDLQLAQAAADEQLASLRLQSLQAQIEPHFLFNTLATVRRLGSTDPRQGEALLSQLHDYIRLSHLGEIASRGWTVGDEVALVRAYLGVIETRMSGLLRLRFELDPAALRCVAPPLMLATLVENAVQHGIEPSAWGGEIAVGARRDAGRLQLRVADTGVGFGASSGGTGVGLANTRSRLRSLYGGDAALVLAAGQPCGAIATLTLPAHEVPS